MRIEFNYIPEDLREALRWKGSKAGRGRRRRRILLGIYIVAFGAALFVWLRPSATVSPGNTHSGQHVDLLFDTFLPLIPWVVIVLFVVFVLRLQSRRHMKIWHTHPEFQQPHTMEFDEKGVARSTPLSEILYRWPYFVQFAETPNLFLLVLPGDLRVIIPKRALKTAEEVEALREILRNNVRESAGGFAVEPFPASNASNQSSQ